MKRGADLNARTEPTPGRATAFSGPGGMTPFLTAAQTGSIEMMKELIALGADVNEKTLDGSNGLLLAVTSRRLDAVKFLVENGVNVNDAPKGRGTALHSAIRFGSNSIVQYLADHGADFTIKDGFGRNAVEEADFEAPKPTIELVKKLAAERAKQ